jgi:hypothetical protein
MKLCWFALAALLVSPIWLVSGQSGDCFMATASQRDYYHADGRITVVRPAHIDLSGLNALSGSTINPDNNMDIWQGYPVAGEAFDEARHGWNLPRGYHRQHVILGANPQGEPMYAIIGETGSGQWLIVFGWMNETALPDGRYRGTHACRYFVTDPAPQIIQ